MTIRSLPAAFATAFLSGLLLCVSAYADMGASTAKKRVLVLHSYHKGLAWTDGEDQGVTSTLAGHPVEVFTEYMDAKRIHDPNDDQRLAQYLSLKYSRMAFDAVIATDDDAYRFLLDRGLFKPAPVVFCGVNFLDQALLAPQRERFTGVVEDYDVKGTLDAALSLWPGTSRVVVINDRTATGLANRRILDQVMPEYRGRFAVEYLDDLSMRDLLAKVGSLGPGDVILLMTFNRDADGRTFDYDESLDLIASRSKAPIFGVWDFYLGKGIVGGLLVRGFDQGALAAAMALRILSGETPLDIPVVQQSPHRSMFDYDLLRRFGIATARLPENSIVINRPASFYEEHQGKVLAAGGVFLAMLGLVVALSINIQDRKRTEASLRESEEKFERIFRHSPDWIAILRLRDGMYVDVNDAFEEVTGFGRAEVMGRTSMDIGIYIDPMERYELDERFLRQGRTQNQELRYRRKSGEVITVERSGELVEIGGEKCIVSIVRDITQKKQAELALQESERQKKLRAEAEIKMLQAQINPHFLFNAITSILHSIRTDPDTASDLLMRLGDFFRKNITPGGDSVPLSKELDHCEDYLSIELARFEDRLTVAYDIDPAALDCRVPPLLLQPLVENAIRHGVMPKEEGGRIVIAAKPEEGDVRISVSDDGVGMDQALLGSLLSEEPGVAPRKGVGLALSNVNARLVAIHGPRHGLRIDSAPGRGTTVSFTVPRL